MARPCADFVVPKDGLYPGYCNRCGYSQTAHEKWDEWSGSEAMTPATAARCATTGLSTERCEATLRQRRHPVTTVTCQWYALCANDAVGTVRHPILGDVQVCQRCADKHDMQVIT